MAELKLTDEEKKLSSLMDFDDAALGKIIKRTIVAIGEECTTDDTEKIIIVTCAHMLVAAATESNATESTIEIDGLYSGDKELGAWKITINRVGAP